MEDQKFGVEKIKEALERAIGFGVEVARATEDKKIKFSEGAVLLGKAAGLGVVITGWEDIKNEYNELSDNERAELIAHFAAKLELDNDKNEMNLVEHILEEAFELLVSLDKFIQNFRKQD